MQHLRDGAQREDHPVPLVPYPTGPACTSPSDEKAPEAASGQLRGSRACQSHAPSSSERCRSRVNRRRTPQATFGSVHTQSFASGERKTTPPCNLGHPGNLPPRSSARRQQLLLAAGSPGTGAQRAVLRAREESDATRGSSSAHATERPRFQELHQPSPGPNYWNQPSWHRCPSAEGHSQLCSCCPSRALL